METPASIPPVATPPIPPAPSSPPTAKKRITPFLIVALVILCIGSVSVYEYFRFSASQPTQIVQPIVTSNPTTVTITATTTPSLAELQRPTSMTEEAYNKAFTDAGGLVLNLEGDTINIRISGTIPNLQFLPDNKVNVEFTSVTDASGKNIIDTVSPFEKDPFFTGADMREATDPDYHFSGSRRIHLAEGVSSSDIHRVEGTVAFTLPIGLAESTFTIADISKQQSNAGTFTLLTWETSSAPADAENEASTSTQVILDYVGLQEKLLTVKAYDADGKELYARHTPPLSYKGMDTVKYDFTFDEKPKSIKVFTVDHLFVKKVPFTLEKNPVSQPTTMIDEITKKALIDAEINREAIFATNDTKQIRAYIQTTADATGQADVMADVLNMSDEEIIQLAKTVNTMFSLGTPDQVRAALLSDKTTWEQLTPETIKYTYHVSKDESNSSTLMKGKDGKWY